MERAPKNSSGNVLQDANRFRSEESKPDKGLGDIKDPCKQSAPENCASARAGAPAKLLGAREAVEVVMGSPSFSSQRKTPVLKNGSSRPFSRAIKPFW